MDMIKLENVEQERENLKKLTKNYKIMSKKLQGILEENGYEMVCLGTGKQSQSSSLEIDVWELNNSFLAGTYVGVGASNYTWGRGRRYRAMVKKVG